MGYRPRSGHAIVETMTSTITAPVAPTTGAGRRPGVLPGLALAAAAAMVAYLLQRVVPAASPLLVAIVLGAIAARTPLVGGATHPGLQVASKRVLRLGIVVLGLQLSLHDIAELGWGVITVAVAVVAIGIVTTLALGARLGIPAPRRLLIACGFSICGAAAVAAVAGAEESDEEDVATAIGLVVLFGTAMIVVCPLLLPVLGLSVRDQGLVAGAAIHEVAQVVAVGGILGGTALSAAVVIKLARVLLLAPVILVLSVRRRRRSDGPGQAPPLVPLFVVGFLAMVTLRTVASVPQPVLDLGGTAQVLLLAAAMFALGTGLRADVLRRIGARSALLATASTTVVFGVALTGILLTV